MRHWYRQNEKVIHVTGSTTITREPYPTKKSTFLFMILHKRSYSTTNYDFRFSNQNAQLLSYPNHNNVKLAVDLLVLARAVSANILGILFICL